MAAKGEAAEEAAHKHRATVQFMKAVDPKQASAAGRAGGGAGGRGRRRGRSRDRSDGGRGRRGQPGRRRAGARGRARAAERRRRSAPTPATTPRRPSSRKWLASEAKKAGLPPELPVMASLVESGVKNLKGGDADSAGFFQMRVGIWDNGPYKGYRMNPQLQAKWFIDNALAGQEGAPRGRQVRHRPGLVRRVDRGRRAPGGAVPLQVPAAPDRGAQADRRLSAGAATAGPPPAAATAGCARRRARA